MDREGAAMLHPSRRTPRWSKTQLQHANIPVPPLPKFPQTTRSDSWQTATTAASSNIASPANTRPTSDFPSPASTAASSVYDEDWTVKPIAPLSPRRTRQLEQQTHLLPADSQEPSPTAAQHTSDASDSDAELSCEPYPPQKWLGMQTLPRTPPPQTRISRLAGELRPPLVRFKHQTDIYVPAPAENHERRSLQGGVRTSDSDDEPSLDRNAIDDVHAELKRIVEAAFAEKPRTRYSHIVTEPEPVVEQVERTRQSKPLTFPTTQRQPKVRLVDTDGSLRKKGRRKILLQKYLVQSWQVSLNAFCIFSTWWWMRYYYILLPLITATVALNVAMVFSLAIRRTWNAIFPEKIIMPESPESMVLLIPCYNETKEELVRSLDSLVAQRNLDDHKKAIVIVCDGKVRGPGMEKSTADYLLQDILTKRTSRKYLKGAYTAWDQQPMDIVVQKGTYGGLPYYCIVKQQNQGKRDGLIVARSFLYNFNRRNEEPSTVFDPAFFNDLATYLVEDAGIENVTHLIGMDADTVFDDDCIFELLNQSRYPGTVGVCGYVSVDWKNGHWNAWRLYQSAEYTIAQALRRLHQSMVTHKVSCLPGCCQLLRICEETCGDRVLLDLFGYCPDLTDGLLRQIRATASEDRNHVCHMLTARPESLTRQALYAKAYTDVPKSWSVFLSQRRRWTLGATSNDLLLVTSRGVQWFERILAAVNVSTWFLNPFIFASLASFIFAITTVPVWIIMCFVGVMIIPLAYCALIPVWLCKRWRERVQFWAGLSMYVFCGPFINIGVLCYALVYLDSFGWGKTRKVIAEDTTSASSSDSELDRLKKGERHSDTNLSDYRLSLSEYHVSEKTSLNSAREGSSAGTMAERDIADEERTVGL